MGAAGRAGDEHARHHGKAPSYDDGHPSGTLAFGLVESVAGTHAVAEENENESSQEFCKIWIHFGVIY